MREGTTSEIKGDARVVRGILLDLDGVVYVGGSALPGSLEAISRIRAAELPLKFITNTTRRPRRRIVRDLAQLGLQVAPEDVYTPAALAHDFLARRNLAPFLVVHPELREDFSGLRTDGEEAVVVGDAGEFFTYDLLNRAYRKILQGAEFLALAKNRNFLDHDGELSLDAGPFVAALEYASGREATVLGKPAPTFFKLAVEGLRCAVEDVAMIGDDAEGPCCTEVSKGATAPSWNHLRNADEIGLPEFSHSVERFDRDGNFGHAARVIARLQGISDDALVATDRRFNFRASVVASRLLPVHSPVRVDGENMLVSLGWRCRDRWPSHGSLAWRHDDLAFGFLARTPSRT